MSFSASACMRRSARRRGTRYVADAAFWRPRSPLALFAPNVIWNAQHGFPTVRHTETNIGWQYPYIHPLRLVEYVIVQFAVFGPILMAVLLRTIWRELPKPSDPRKVLLLSFSLPVLGLLVFQALLSRAHGNWSATAYPAASILVTAVMLELNRETLFRVSLALHLAFAVVVAAAPAFAKHWRLFEQVQFLERVVGWHESADIVRAKLAEQHYGSILVDTREVAGELLYYLRDVSVPLYVWPTGPMPNDHYEMTRPFTTASPEPVLYVSLKPCPASLAKAFGQITDLGIERVTLRGGEIAGAAFLPSCRLQRRPAGALSGATDWRWSSPGHSHLPARRRRRSRHWRIRA